MGKAQSRLSMYLLLVQRGKVLRGSFPSTKYFVAKSSLSPCPLSIQHATWTDTETGCQQDCPLHIFTTVSTVLASQKNWPCMSLERLALPCEKQHGPWASCSCQKKPGALPAQFKGHEITAREKRGQLQPAACCVHVEPVLACSH